ncbi:MULTISPECIES: hypothetical protein [Lactobacillus]|uniref:DUF4231 domain-containing protein n=1 Tax=Lactobacillus mulieris TaxID=2508708 RepID=A0ABT4K5L5_9LACO|nr:MULTISPECIES: hypothetical protein [Lactobacillus]MCZ3622541.1 hypothetical protein [Lactobacillus mulieris]MCZ3624179.1 hypothetical protein [Lactobacillus mulieris]MCZ3636548.1 hypothetical protein [Lactobacillus mulieris]MCZ3742006.1 hypothetical protein [Lactobacillus mulieris]MCZ3745515.1 hypothetical protein [Lactobacillus mulieris]
MNEDISYQKYISEKIGRQMALDKIEKNYPNVVNAVEIKHHFNCFNPATGYSHTFTFKVMASNYLSDTLTINVVVKADDFKNPPDYSRSLNYIAAMKQLKLEEIGTVRRQYLELLKSSITKMLYAQMVLTLAALFLITVLIIPDKDKFQLIGMAGFLILLAGIYDLLAQISVFKKEGGFISMMEKMKWEIEHGQE